MSFSEAIQTVFRKYADFSGRASRPEFWWWILFTVLVGAVLNSLPIWGFGPLWGFDPGDGGFSPRASLAGAWALVVLVPNLAVTVRRLRDAGYSWANLFWIFLPVAGLIVLIVMCSQPPAGSAGRIETQTAWEQDQAPSPDQTPQSSSHHIEGQ